VAGKTRTLSVTLPRKNQRLLKRLGKLRVTVTAVAKDAAGNSGTSKRAFILKG
jgi:hypothetical protein